MNINNIHMITNKLLVTIQSRKKDTLSEIATAIALAELDDAISKMCYDDIN